MHREYITGFTSFDINWANNRIKQTRCRFSEFGEMSVIEAVNKRIVTIVVNHPGERIVCLNLEYLTRFNFKTRFISIIECVALYFPAFDFFHTGLVLFAQSGSR